MSVPSVLVVGAGFSGVMTALHLLAQPGGLRVVLAERGAAFGPGLAYGRAGADHLLNVRAANMSAFPDRPSHFLDWLRERGEAHGEGDAFVRRSLYGEYLRRLMGEAGAALGRLDLVGDRVVDLRPLGNGRLEAAFSVGWRRTFDAVVLAVGNLPPAQAAGVAAHPRHIVDPWAEGALSDVRPSDRVLLLGCGLTMIDVTETLTAAGHRGPLFAVSRRGLLPHRHESSEPTAPPPEVFDGPLSARVRAFRRAARVGAGWRSTFDSLRPHVEPLWRGLSEAERRRFLRHLQPYWDVHRHRQAPAIADRVAAQAAAGRLTVGAGKLVEVAPAGERLKVAWRPRGRLEARTTIADWLVNCTGAGGDLAGSGDPLLQSLLEAGLIRQDALGLGVDVTGGGAAISAAGAASMRLTAIGPLTRGAFWECTAVPDLRTKAADLAGRIAATLAERRPVSRAAE